jgi:hypothetical protein
MLRDAFTAGLVKLQCDKGFAGERRLRAGQVPVNWVDPTWCCEAENGRCGAQVDQCCNWHRGLKSAPKWSFEHMFSFL